MPLRTSHVGTDEVDAIEGSRPPSINLVGEGFEGEWNTSDPQAANVSIAITLPAITDPALSPPPAPDVAHRPTRKAPTRKKFFYGAKLLYRTGVHAYFETHRRGMILPVASADRKLAQLMGSANYDRRSRTAIGQIKAFRDLTDSPVHKRFLTSVIASALDQWGDGRACEYLTDLQTALQTLRDRAPADQTPRYLDTLELRDWSPVELEFRSIDKNDGELSEHLVVPSGSFKRSEIVERIIQRQYFDANSNDRPPHLFARSPGKRARWTHINHDDQLRTSAMSLHVVPRSQTFALIVIKRFSWLKDLTTVVDRAQFPGETDCDRVCAALRYYGTSCLYNLETDDEVPKGLWGNLLSEITCNHYGLAEYTPPHGRR